MAQTRPSYAYNPDLPIRKWHQKWINPVISLQNAPPATHGTPAPTKEDGEAAPAGFKIRTWIPLDEDDDVTDEMLQQEVDWWNKPGAPLRLELRATRVEQPASLTSGTMDVDAEKEKEAQDVLMPDAPSTPAPMTNGVAESASTELPAADIAVEQAGSPVPAQPPNVPSPRRADTEMIDAEPSPVHLSTVRSISTSPVRLSPQPPKEPSPPTTTREAKSPLSQPVEALPVEGPTIDDILPPSKPSPSDPLAQAQEVAAGLAPELSAEHAEHVSDPGNLSGVGGGIAGEGIAGSGDTDMPGTETTKGDKGRTEEEQQIIEQSKEDLETDIIKGAAE